MTNRQRVLVVAPADASRLAAVISHRGFDVEVVETPVWSQDSRDDVDCVVCLPFEEFTVSELVQRFLDVSPVVFVSDDDATNATALDAGATHAISSGDPDGNWGSYLAATVETACQVTKSDERESLFAYALDELPDIFFIVGVDGEMVTWNEKLAEVTGYDDAEIADMSPTDFFEGDDVARIENTIGRIILNGQATAVADLTSKKGHSIPYEFTGSLITVDDRQAIVGTARDVRERLRRESELAERTEQLETVNEVNSLIRDFFAVLLEAESRNELVSGVCEQLTGEDGYRFAWIGSYDVESGRVEPEAWAGEGDGYLDVRPDSREDEGVTALTAVREERVVFAQNVAADIETERWRAAALEYGHRAAAAIPISYGHTMYGCLCLYAAKSDSFGSLEREVLAEFGDIIGHAIHAVETRRALAADTVTELQYRVVDPESFLVQVSRHADAELTLVGSTGQPNGSIVQLYAVSGIDTDRVRYFTRESPFPAEVVTEGENECIIKVTLEKRSPAHVLTDVDGSIRDIKVSDGEVRVRAHLPRRVDEEDVLDRINELQPIEFLSRREVDRSERTDVEFRVGVKRHLTERQIDVVRTAYDAGFFEWPREQTGEEIADLLGVSPPTFHQHVRLAEQRLLEVLFDRGPVSHDVRPNDVTQFDTETEQND